MPDIYINPEEATQFLQGLNRLLYEIDNTITTMQRSLRNVEGAWDDSAQIAEEKLTESLKKIEFARLHIQGEAVPQMRAQIEWSERYRNAGR